MRDARFLPDDALEKLRWRAVAMVRGGATQVAAAKALGVHKNTVSLWLKWWREGGDAALKPKRRGRTSRKEARIIEMLKPPQGATVEQIAEATGWQHRTICCAISKRLKKKLKLAVEATRTREVGSTNMGAKGSSIIYRIIEAG
jgi:transposase